MTKVAGDNLEGALSPFLRRQRFNAARPHIRGRVLDYACGVGLLKDALGIADYTGVDLDESVLAIARERCPGCAFLRPDQLGELNGATFDTVAGLAVIEHLPDPVAFLRTAKGLLSPGGAIVLTTPNPAFDWAHGLGGRIGVFSKASHAEHQSLMGRDGLRRAALAAGLTIALYKRFLLGVNQLALLVRAP